MPNALHRMASKLIRRYLDERPDDVLAALVDQTVAKMTAEEKYMLARGQMEGFSKLIVATLPTLTVAQQVDQRIRQMSVKEKAAIAKARISALDDEALVRQALEGQIKDERLRQWLKRLLGV